MCHPYELGLGINTHGFFKIWRRHIQVPSIHVKGLKNVICLHNNIKIKGMDIDDDHD
jgi:hypothetical protein